MVRTLVGEASGYVTCIKVSCDKHTDASFVVDEIVGGFPETSASAVSKTSRRATTSVRDLAHQAEKKDVLHFSNENVEVSFKQAHTKIKQ